MAYLRILKKGDGRYYYVLKSLRRRGKVTSKVLEYLGRDPDRERLKRALEYWGVKKPKKTKGRRSRWVSTRRARAGTSTTTTRPGGQGSASARKWGR